LIAASFEARHLQILAPADRHCTHQQIGAGENASGARLQKSIRNGIMAVQSTKHILVYLAMKIAMIPSKSSQIRSE
jgi:hypothetical protein